MWNRRWKRRRLRAIFLRHPSLHRLRHDVRAEYLLVLATFLIVILVLAVAAITALR